MDKLRRYDSVIRWQKDCDVIDFEIAALNKIIPIVNEFDGKVINKRFLDALNKVTLGVYYSIDWSNYLPTLRYFIKPEEREYHLTPEHKEYTEQGKYGNIYILMLTKELLFILTRATAA